MKGTKYIPKWWVNREGKILVVVMLTWMLSLCRKQFGVPNCGDFEGIACNMCSTYMEGIVITSSSSPSSSPLSSHLHPSSPSFSDSTVLCSTVLARRKPMPLCSL